MATHFVLRRAEPILGWLTTYTNSKQRYFVLLLAIESRFGSFLVEDTREKKLMLAWSGEPVLWTLANHIGMVQVLWGFRISWEEASSSCAMGFFQEPPSS